MNDIYSNFEEEMTNYMYPKQYRVLNVTGQAPTEPEEVELQEEVQEEIEAPVAEAETPADVISSPEVPAAEAVAIDVNSFKKADLIAFVKERIGEDADVSGTKAEIIARYF